MKRKLFCCVLFVLHSLFSNAQNSFQMTIGGPDSDNAWDAIQTMDGGYLVSGATRSYGVAFYNAYLVKLNLYGDTVWTRTISESCGSCTSYNHAYESIQLEDSSYIIVGGRYASLINHATLVKLSSRGSTSWIRTYEYHDVVFGNAIEQTADGGYILGCTTWDTAANPIGSDLALIKTDSAGSIQWSKKYSENNAQYLSDILITGDSGLILAGSRRDPNGVTALSYYLVKTNIQGDTLWAKQYARMGNTKSDGLQAVIQTSDGGFLLTGIISHPAGDPSEILVSKTDSLGNLAWSYSYGTISGDGGEDAVELSNGSYLISGYSDGSAILLNISNSGSILWVKSYALGTFETVRKTADGGIVLSGMFRATVGTYSDAYLVKTNAALTSGCNEQIRIFNTVDQTANTIVTSVSPQVDTNAATLIGSLTFISSGGTTTPICYVGEGEIISEENSLQIWPNPSGGNFYIASSFVIEKAIVFDALGQKVYERMIDAKDASIDLSICAAGIYYLQVYMENDKVRSKKLVLTR